MRRIEQPGTPQQCGPNCPYRGLYEGSQRSLTDLAARQADALGRIGRLRSQIVLGLKKILPNEFNEAERALGRRLSEVDDELLGAYLESFLLLASGKASAEASALQRVKVALQDLGVDVSRARSLNDVASILETTQPNRTGIGAIFENTPAPQRPMREVTAVVESPAAASPGAPTPGASAPNAATRTMPATTMPATTIPATTMPAPTPPTNDPLAPASPRRAFVRATGDVSNPTSPKSPEPSELDALFDEAGPSTGGGSGTSSLRDLFGDDYLDDPVPGPSDEPAEFAAGASTSPSSQPATSTRQGDVVAPSNDVVQVNPVPAPATGTEVTSRALAQTGGMRPALLPTPPKTRQRRTKNTVRTSVLPGEVSLDVPSDEPTGPSALDQAMSDRLLAAVSIPRPVFTADLVDMVKSPELVDEWQSRASAEQSIRVIAAKGRHKLRGALVFPKNDFSSAGADVKRSTWVRCVTKPYLGAKIYELGVLLHRFGEEVMSDELGNHTVLLRLNRPQGMVGLLVLLEASLGEGEPAREALVSGLETFMRERLIQIVVLSINADNLNSIAEVVAEEAERREWAPAMPVALARSWEYANGTGVSLALLGA